MTDAEILAAMRAKKAEADECQTNAQIMQGGADRLRRRVNDLWFEIHKLHNALLHPDPTL